MVELAAEPRTPYLRVDLVRLRHNVRSAAERAAAAGVSLRPHVKTHKCVEIARLQRDAGAVGITVATLGEAEVFARAGFDDLLVAYPLWVDDRAAGRIRDLVPVARVTIGVDSAEGVAAAGRHLGGGETGGLSVLVEVDSGHHRSGVAPEEAGTIAAAAHRAGLDVRGVFTFPGHGYAPGAGATAAADEQRALATAVAALRAEGLEAQVVSGGSTPTLAASLDSPGVLTELRPGVHALGDAQQWELGAMRPEDLALTCRATVVSRAGGRMVLDAGSKALGADRAPYATGWGRLLDDPTARIVQLSEHHAVVEPGTAPPRPVGERVDVVPNHVCSAVNLVDHLYVEEHGSLRAWEVRARGRNS